MRPVGFLAMFVLLPSMALAATGPRWTPVELIEFADVVVTGRVTSVASGWDPQVNAIYTYVTVDVAEVLKGDITAEQITVKQLGGTADGLALAITDQASFYPGEDVLLYLEARPRDGTLYTTALWQGKWDLQRGPRGQQVAVRSAPAQHAHYVEEQLLSDVRASAASATRTEGRQLTPQVADAPVQRASAGFNLLGPYRYAHSPAVDTQAGGQPGLAGGGFYEIQSAIGRWNNAGTSFRFQIGGTSAPPRCSGEMLGNGRVTITFMDPCGEMSNSGGTLALGGSYYLPGSGGSLNGQSFEQATEGFIVNNDSPLALSYLTNPGCFEEVQTHELGHVLGLHHSSDATALMYATIDSGLCRNGARGLRQDDLEGVRFIYGMASALSAAPPSAAPTDVRVVVQPSSITVSWTAPPDDVASGASATEYRVDFREGHFDVGRIVASSTTSATALSVSVPTNVAGAFNVIVTAVNAAGAGPSSERRDFTLAPSGTMCSSAPLPVTSVSGSVINGVARLGWSPAASATRYIIQAGTSIGLADLFATTDVGLTTDVTAPVPTGFRAHVRVVAANACGLSTPIDFVLQ
jgi:hypothetical protein